MKSTKLFLGVLVVLITMSFKDKDPAAKVKTGIYGTCSCGNESATKVELTINEDFTFHYFDNYDPKKPIDIKGSWTISENTISLTNYTSDFKIHNKWQIDSNEKCLKSRKGLEFTRLCHIKSCN